MPLSNKKNIILLALCALMYNRVHAMHHTQTDPEYTHESTSTHQTDPTHRISTASTRSVLSYQTNHFNADLHITNEPDYSNRLSTPTTVTTPVASPEFDTSRPTSIERVPSPFHLEIAIPKTHENNITVIEVPSTPPVIIKKQKGLWIWCCLPWCIKKN